MKYPTQREQYNDAFLENLLDTSNRNPKYSEKEHQQAPRTIIIYCKNYRIGFTTCRAVEKQWNSGKMMEKQWNSEKNDRKNSEKTMEKQWNSEKKRWKDSGTVKKRWKNSGTEKQRNTQSKLYYFI